MGSDILNHVANYWNGLCRNGTLPHRGDIDPIALQPALEHLFILERVAGSPVRIRLAGLQVCQMVGMEARGMPVRVLFDAESRPQIDKLISRVLTGPALVDITAEIRLPDRSVLGAELILRPLLHNSDTPNRVLGCLVIQNGLPRPPMQLSIKMVQEKPVFKGGDLKEKGFAEAQAPFLLFQNQDSLPSATEPSAADPQKTSHLRLVHDIEE